jgi:hypothetical protein
VTVSLALDRGYRCISAGDKRLSCCPSLNKAGEQDSLIRTSREPAGRREVLMMDNCFSGEYEEYLKVGPPVSYNGVICMAGDIDKVSGSDFMEVLPQL